MNIIVEILLKIAGILYKMWQFTKSGYRLDDVDSYIYKISAILNLFNDTKVKRSNMSIVLTVIL